MKLRIFYSILFAFLLLISAGSCQSEASKKADQIKADSLEKQTQHAMDSANDAILKQMNETDDSSIVNDPAAPIKSDK